MKSKYKSATMTNKMKQAPKTVSKAKSGQVVDGRWRCEQVPGASCPFVRARRCLPARHHCPHYLFTGCPPAIWSTSGPTWAGEHLEQWATYQDASIAGVGDTLVHLPTSHLPTHNCHLAQQLGCPNSILLRGHLASNYLHRPRSHKGIRIR